MSASAGSRSARIMESGSPARNDARKKTEMTYHYAGKVHVRGLLRRVWRPRYLALGDDGYLRYHESIPPLFQQDPQHNNPYSMSISSSSHELYSLHNTHRPKTILAILDGARTIDPYSVVDRHVALPQGVYGFVFRGRPVELYTTESSRAERGGNPVGSNNDAEQGALILPPEDPNGSDAILSPGSQSSKHSKKAAVVNLVFPKGTERRRTAQKIAKQAINPDVLCGFGRTPNSFEGGLLSRSSSSSSLMGYEQTLIEEESDHGLQSNQWGIDSHESHASMGSYQRVDSSQVRGDLSDDQPVHPPRQKERMQNATQTKSTIQVQVQAASIQSREYLCAVSTAEEAESWVVALRWAAEHRRRIKYERAAPRRNEADHSASIPSGVVTNSDLASSDHLDVSERSDTGRTRDAGVRSGDGGINPGDGDQQNSDSQGSGDSSVCGDSNTNREFGGDSKESLTSLLIEQEGWCKAGDEKKKISVDDKQETLTADHPEPLLPKVGDKQDNAQYQSDSPPSRLHPTIVVTKVCKFQPPQISAGLVGTRHSSDEVPWLPFRWTLPGTDLDLQYEIQLLLLRNCKRLEETVRPESIEERNISKSLHEILALVRGLIKEFAPAQKDTLKEDRVETDHSTPQRKGSARSLEDHDTIHLLEDVESTLLKCLGSIATDERSSRKLISAAKGAVDEILSRKSAALASVGVVDNVMRKLSKDGSVCSSEHFQKFLGLHANHYHHHPSTPVDKSTETDAEQIVKRWLSGTSHPSIASKAQLLLAVTLRHRIWGPILSLVVAWSSARLASVLWSAVLGSRIIVSVPLETYTSLVALAFFFGHYNGMSTQHDRRLLRKQMAWRPVADTSARTEAFSEESLHVVDDDQSTVAEEGSESGDEVFIPETSALSSPLPTFPDNRGISCWSKPDHRIFMVRSSTYLEDRVKLPSAPAVFRCRGVDVWITDNAERNISRHPSVLGGELYKEDTFVVNFLLPFSNFVAYFTIPPIAEMPANIAEVWTRFIRGDQEYRDGKLKLLPVVVDGPWIVKKAVGPGTAPAMIGRDLPLQYYFSEPTATKKGVYEVDVLVTASRIARGILNVVKGHTKSLTIAFAFIIEASEEAHLPETVLCAFQVHSLHLEDCPNLPDCYPDG